MVEISISRDLKQNIPNLALGVVLANIETSKHNSDLWEEINKKIAQFSPSLSLEALYNVSEIKELRNGYKSIGKDPTRYRGSAEALSRRIIQGKGLYEVNTIVDINNLVSLETMNSVGSYDLGKLNQPIVFRIGKENESYKGIGKEVINIADLPVFADKDGPFGSPTSDSERAMITINTRELMMVMISFTGSKSLQNNLDRIKDLLCHYANGSKDQIETFIVD